LIQAVPISSPINAFRSIYRPDPIAITTSDVFTQIFASVPTVKNKRLGQSVLNRPIHQLASQLNLAGKDLGQIRMTPQLRPQVRSPTGIALLAFNNFRLELHPVLKQESLGLFDIHWEHELTS
jgi:hypothetical protein